MIGNRRGKLEPTRRTESHQTLKSHWHQELNSYPRGAYETGS